jgi:hypothetical protein
MRDYLLDLVEHTLDLGCIDLVKIVGTEEATKIVAVASDGTSVVLLADFKNPVPEFIGTFGMPNLNKLKILLNLQEYRENSKLSITRRAQTNAPDGINFENASGDFKNNYRFMGEDIVAVKLQTPKFAGANWHVEFEPTVAGIQRLRMQAQANAEEPNFQAKTENGDLKFFFGDHSTHAGNFVFHPGVTGALTRTWSWPVAQFQNILALSGDKKVHISSDGAAMITVDSGIAVYKYILPAQSK